LKIYSNLYNYTSKNKTFVTIGTFDGVHIGHKKVIKDLINNAKKNGATSVLLTFFPHPRVVLQKEASIKLINTIEERINLLEKLGLDVLVIHEFNEKFAKQSALDFVKNVLVNKLNIGKLVIGYDHHFGNNREGNFKQLVEYGKIYNFDVKAIPRQDISNIAISSTKIRKAIEHGQIIEANQNLGYPFMISGCVVKGKNLGEKIGFPTANLHLNEKYKLLPKTGAYIVKSEIKNKKIFGMMNIGFRPTVSGKNQTIEIHFFDFNENIYNETIQVDVLKFLREEQKFESIEDLKNQLKKDKENSIKFIQNHL